MHRLFELTWVDFFAGTEIVVEPEMDLSLKKQLLDLVIIRGVAAPPPRPLPDGFEVLAPHNLMTFKSYQEALDGWALCELIGHYINYRKQSSPSMQELLPEDDFQLFAVYARFPRDLAQQAALTHLRDGVFELQVVTKRIRIIVLNQLPQTEHNAMLHLFSAREELLRYGREHYRPHSRETSTLLHQLFSVYSEDPEMSQKMQEFVRETIDELLNSLPPEELRKHLPLEERLKGLSDEEVLRVLQSLSPATREVVARAFKANGNGSKPQ